MTLEHAQHTLDTAFTPWIQELSLRVVSTDANKVELVLPGSARLKQAEGLLGNQVYMVVADTAMSVALLCSLDDSKAISTISLNTTFIQSVCDGDVRIVATIKRRGRNIAFGEISLYDQHDHIVGHANGTYALR